MKKETGYEVLPAEGPLTPEKIEAMADALLGLILGTYVKPQEAPTAG